MIERNKPSRKLFSVNTKDTIPTSKIEVLMYLLIALNEFLRKGQNLIIRS